jgi:hypothetical protein
VLKSDHFNLAGVFVSEPKSEMVGDTLFWEVGVPHPIPRAIYPRACISRSASDPVCCGELTLSPARCSFPYQTVVTLKSAEAEDEYTIAFHRCDESPMGVGSVTAEIDIVEVNPGPDYVGAGLVRTTAACTTRIHF